LGLFKTCPGLRLTCRSKDAALVTGISDDNFFNTNVLKQNCQIKYAKESVSKFGDAVSNMADAVGDAASKAGDVASKTAEEMKSRIKNFF